MRQDVFDASNIFNFQEKSIHFAFGIEGFLDKEQKNDTKYIKSFARIYGYKDGEIYEHMIPFYPC